jgi:antitoxin (DNA-binding transcriptional repressor) of toxin-antitoxin stability system
VKTIEAESTNLGKSLDDAQRERVLITRAGRPIAVLVGLEGLDDEQLALCRSGEFWELIAKRRSEPAMSRAELERALGEGA